MIHWRQITPTEAHYTNGKDRYKYELWVNGELLDNTIRNEFEIARIVRYGYRSRWREKQR